MKIEIPLEIEGDVYEEIEKRVLNYVDSLPSILNEKYDEFKVKAIISIKDI